MSALYKCPICGDATNHSSINYQPQPCLGCSKQPSSLRRDLQVEPTCGGDLQVDLGTCTVDRMEFEESTSKGTTPPPKGSETPFYHIVSNTPATPECHPKHLKEGYWYEQYQLILKKYWKQISENSKQAELIRELHAVLSNIVDWSPELPYYMKDEDKMLFRNALAYARELLSNENRNS